METNTRRDFLARGTTGLAALSVAELFRQEAATGQVTPTPVTPPEPVVFPPIVPTTNDRTLLAETTIAAVLDKLGPQIDAIYNDPDFRKAYEPFDVDSFSEEFNTFTENTTAYNVFHRRERRLWSIKIGTGSLPDNLSAPFLKSIPAGRENYSRAFGAIDRIAGMLTECGLHTIAERYLAPFTAVLGDEKHPFTQMVVGYFRQAGCSQQMIDEFTKEFAIIDFDFLGAAGGFGKVRERTTQAVAAQLSILDYTEKNGFQYISGRCGPPKWAIVASQILAAAGISISAWVIVAIIVSLLAVLALICAVAPSGSWLEKKCVKLEVLLPIFSF